MLAVAAALLMFVMPAQAEIAGVASVIKDVPSRSTVRKSGCTRSTRRRVANLPTRCRPEMALRSGRDVNRYGRIVGRRRCRRLDINERLVNKHGSCGRRR